MNVLLTLIVHSVCGMVPSPAATLSGSTIPVIVNAREHHWSGETPLWMSHKESVTPSQTLLQLLDYFNYLIQLPPCSPADTDLEHWSTSLVPVLHKLFSEQS